MRRFAAGLLLGLLFSLVSDAGAGFGSNIPIRYYGVDASLRAQPTTAGYAGFFVPPYCPPDTSNAPLGSMCIDMSNPTPKLMVKEGGGLRIVTTTLTP